MMYAGATQYHAFSIDTEACFRAAFNLTDTERFRLYIVTESHAAAVEPGVFIAPELCPGH